MSIPPVPAAPSAPVSSPFVDDLDLADTAVLEPGPGFDRAARPAASANSTRTAGAAGAAGFADAAAAANAAVAICSTASAAAAGRARAPRSAATGQRRAPTVDDPPVTIDVVCREVAPGPAAEPAFLRATGTPAVPGTASALRTSQRLALVVALALVVVWGANFSIQKLIFPVIGPDGFLFGRYLLMPALAALIMCVRYGVDWPPIDKPDRWLLVKLAVAGHLLHVGLVTWGIDLSTAFSSAVMLACGPLFTLLLLRLTGAERLNAFQVVGVVAALAGVLVFLSDKLIGVGWRAGWGDLVLLVAASFFSYYTVAAKDVIHRIGGTPVMAYTTLIASPMLVAATWRGGMSVDWASLQWVAWIAFLWSVVVSAFLGWLLWGWVNAVRGVARTAPLMYLMPVVAGVVAWWLGESFSPLKAGGAALTLAGVALAQARVRSRPGASAPLVPARMQVSDTD